jgi:ribosomal protein L11 methyltransferase
MLREITLLADAESADALSDALLEAGALSVSIEDADADTADEQPLYGEPGGEPERAAWTHNRMSVLLPAGVDPAQFLAVACEGLSIGPPPICRRREVEDADWVRLTQAQFPPTRIGERLWIVPSWHEPPDPAAINIRLDPGVAFGTGTHPTTRLCLAWLLQNMPRGARVLDYGCGSGVLAIAAAKLGAREVIGTTSTSRRSTRPAPTAGEMPSTLCTLRRASFRPDNSTSCSPTSSPTLCGSSRRCCWLAWRRAVRWCSPACCSGRPTS